MDKKGQIDRDTIIKLAIVLIFLILVIGYFIQKYSGWDIAGFFRNMLRFGR